MPFFVLREVLPCFRGSEVDLFLIFVYNLKNKFVLTKSYKKMRRSRMLLWSSWRMYWRLELGGGGEHVANSRQNFPAIRPQRMSSVAYLFCFLVAFDHKKNNFSLFYFIKGKSIIILSAYI
jgi:hypothetical protein